ncbi:TonB-dependent receptor [Marinoscillum sp.]|uniref:TonB-dependent receptor n=1 Tax=Marinoscillum sp. TaxID=2024838 RepID=UPI003BAC0A12
MRKTLRNYALFAVMSLTSLVTFAQSKVTGTVIDAETGEGLPGASVFIKGTTTGTITDYNGEFSLSVEGQTATVVISFVGFQTEEKTINLSETQSLGKIALSAGNELSPLEIIASVAVERKTPVAVSSIKRDLIVERASNQEFPELLKSTPGVYATKQGGGFGDARVNVRGFGSENVAVMINGIPVNDMENGAVYWSNWAGLTAVAQSVQVQRGLGAAKVAVPSIGGTINIVTKAADQEKGGSITYGIGNNNWTTTGLSLSTGLTDEGWAFTIYGSRTTGDGWTEGLNFDAYNYFFNLSKAIGKNHTVSLTGFGAPQTHGQRSTRQSIQDWKSHPDGIRYNPDWGYLNGQVYNRSFNFYHKPQFSLNHYWTVDSKSELSTSLYASFGTGGGRRDGGDDVPIVDGQYDYTAAFDRNVANGGEAISWIAASNNDHKWFGVLSTYSRELTSNLNIMAGLDLRQYTGIHYYSVTDLLGAEYVISDDNEDGVDRAIGEGGRYSKDYRGLVGWQGVFLQTEYEQGDLAAFVNLSVSNTGYAMEERMYENRTSDTYNFLGYQIKGGGNYNLTKNHNVFANAGYFEKAPIYDAVFNSERSNAEATINVDAKNEKVMSLELGYGYKSTFFSANINAYRTSWLDKAYTATVPLYDLDADGNQVAVGAGVRTENGYANILGVDALHQGIEFDFKYKPFSALEIGGMASLGDWTWASNVDSTIVRDQNTGDVLPDATVDGLFIKDLKVGNSAQTTFAADLDYYIIKDLKLGFSYNYFGNMYADYSVTNRNTAPENGAVMQPWEAPAYSTVDMRLVYNFKFGPFDAKFLGNINNLLDTEYISDATDGQGSVARTATVYYGLGRTWTATIKVNF